MIENACLFASYGWIQKNIRLLRQIEENSPLSTTDLLISGALAGSCASVVLTPVELIKCQVQVHQVRMGIYTSQSTMQTNKPKKFGTGRALLKVLKNSGIAGLYRGFFWTFIRETGGGAAWFTSYELALRAMFNQSVASKSGLQFDKKHLESWQLVTAGGIAGFTYNLTMFPADVMKSIYQTQSVKTGQNQSSAMSTISRIFKQDGIRGFYRGMGITLLRAIPSNALIFFVYETVQKQWPIN